MHGRRGCLTNIFGEQYQPEQITQTDLDDLKQDITTIMTANKTELDARIKSFEDLISYTKSYISFNGRRIVNVKKSVDNHDVIIKEEFQQSIKDLKELNFTADEMSLVKHNNKRRRISSVEKSKHAHDVVIKKELEDLVQKCYEYQEEMNKRLTYFDNKLKGMTVTEPNSLSITQFNKVSKESKPL